MTTADQHPESKFRQELRAKYGQGFLDAVDKAAAEAPPLTQEQITTLRGLFATARRRPGRAS